MSLTSATVEVVTGLPSSVIVTLSPALTEDGRCAVTVKATGLEQLTVDGVKVRLPYDELVFRYRKAPTITASTTAPMSRSFGVILKLAAAAAGAPVAGGGAW
jgi:hypothetical protein